jgi:hypothetical protein
VSRQQQQLLENVLVVDRRRRAESSSSFFRLVGGGDSVSGEIYTALGCSSLTRRSIDTTSPAPVPHSTSSTSKALSFRT